MSNQGYVDLTLDSPEVVVRKHYSPPPVRNDLNENNRVLPHSIANVPAQNGVLEPKMNAQYMDAPLQQQQPVHNQFRLPHQQPQPPQPPILESLRAGNFQNVYDRVMGGNVVQEGIDALQAHLNKTKVFQAMHQRAAVDDRHVVVRGISSAILPFPLFVLFLFSSKSSRRKCLRFLFHFILLKLFRRRSTSCTSFSG
jgi:hypothetical protein